MRHNSKTNVTSTTAQREGIACGRFSTKGGQELGASEARQASAYTRALSTHGLYPSSRFKIFDKGRSGFHGAHLTSKAELGAFLDKLKSNPAAMKDSNGNMPVLVYETVDRLSRLEPTEANKLLRDIFDAGVGLCFENEFLCLLTKADANENWVRLQCAIDAAWRYSQRLSNRMKDAFARIRESGSMTTKHGHKRLTVPSWITIDDNGAYTMDNEHARTLKSACLDAMNMGTVALRHKYPTLKNLSHTLRSKTLLGIRPQEVYHGRGRAEREKVGEVVGAYPALLSEDEFYRLQAALDKRQTNKGGRKSVDTVSNLLTNLVWNMQDKKAFQMFSARMSRNTMEYRKELKTSKTGGTMVHYLPIETAILSALNTLNPSVFAPKATGEIESKLSSIRGEIGSKSAALETNKTLLESVPSVAIAQTVQRLEKQIEALNNEMDSVKATLSARGDSANVLLAQSLIGRMPNATGEELFSIRSELKTLVSSLVKYIGLNVRSSTSADVLIILSNDGRLSLNLDSGVLVAVASAGMNINAKRRRIRFYGVFFVCRAFCPFRYLIASCAILAFPAAM